MLRKCTLVACLTAALGIHALDAQVSCGQDVAVSELYGRGVHKYFAHDYTAAYDQLSMVIDHGAHDPRVYYYRGLALLAAGRVEAAEADWKQGAAIEAKGSYGGVIGRALARVQGPVRLHLERIRHIARVKAQIAENAVAQARYNTPATPPVELPGADTTPVSPDALAGKPANPFGEGGLSAIGQPQVESQDALSGALENAMPAPVEPAATGGSGAPAGGGNELPDFGNPAGGDDLPDFGDPAPAGDDPFDFGF